MIRTTKALLAVLCCVSLAACATSQHPSSADETLQSVSDATAVEAIRMVAVGDSITAADSPDIAGGEPGPGSWVSYAIGPGIEFVGGWAVWGALTSEMAAGFDAPFDADVLVVLAGTNDTAGVPFEETAANIEAIVERAGIDLVVLSSVPPIDVRAESAVLLNERLGPLAAQHGWLWVDSAAGLRDGVRFAEGMSYDGIHPTEAGARIIGEAIGAAILEASGSG